MDVRLVVDKGPARKRIVRLHSDETIIGRRPDCDLRILSSQVSRRHCLLRVKNGCVDVEDLQSVNGTFINGKRIMGVQVLRPGDQLQVGPIRFVVEYEITQAALDRLEESGNRPPDDEELEVLPVAEDENRAEPTPSASKEEEPGLAPLANKDTDLASSNKTDDEEEPIPLAAEDSPVPEELEDGGSWHLPQSNDLRDLLSGMDDPNGRAPQGKKSEK